MYVKVIDHSLVILTVHLCVVLDFFFMKATLSCRPYYLKVKHCVSDTTLYKRSERNAIARDHILNDQSCELT